MSLNLSQLSLAPLPPKIRSRRTQRVAREFGMNLESIDSKTSTAVADESSSDIDLRTLLPSIGEIIFITGPSGAGKSSLLRQLKSFTEIDRAHRIVDLAQLRFPDRPIVDCFGSIALPRVLETLSHVGLAEVWTYLRTPTELSEGQRWRLRLAFAMLARSKTGSGRGRTGLKVASNFEPSMLVDTPSPRPSAGGRGSKDSPSSTARDRGQLLVSDEFCALLDRVSAAVVARTLRRAISKSTNRCAIVASSHDDLMASLHPDVIVRCDFGSIKVERWSSPISRADLAAIRRRDHAS